jgi:RNA polymerase sigma-70 factor, ECF subfamily
VAAAQAGDVDAFRQLMARHAESVRRFLSDLLRNSDTAEEALQETFTRAQSNLARFHDRDRLRPWLFGIARNVALETLRARRHWRDEAWSESDDENVPDAVISAPNPEALLLDKELRSHFETALNALGIERRAALLMRIDHGLSYEEIADSFGWTLPTVKNEIHRARLKLRAALLPYL